jgi:hypothetical protein
MKASKLESKFVRLIMPDASNEEVAEATWYWFAYLLLLDRIANEKAVDDSRTEDRYVSVDDENPLKA